MPPIPAGAAVTRPNLWRRFQARIFGPVDPDEVVETAVLTRWAEALYRTDAGALAASGVLLAIDQLEAHARALAERHRLGTTHGDDHLLRRLADSERVIGRCHLLLSRAHAAGHSLAPAAEWLLDNRWLITEQIHLARKHFPRGYSRRLPRLANDEMVGRPRIYDLIHEYVAHVDGRIDAEALARYTAAYQSVTPLTLGELWSVAIMLRLALVENLRRVTATMSWQRVHHDQALDWAQRLDRVDDTQDSAFLLLAEMVRENPPLSTTFVTQFTKALQGRGAITSLVLAWLEERLAARGQSVEESLRAESQSLAAAHAAMSNTISSLRLVNANEWHAFVETLSETEQILRTDPAGFYARMDFATRDTYRHAVEHLARGRGLGELQVAQAAVALAAAAPSEPGVAVARHVGYYLVDDGRPHLVRALAERPASALSPAARLRALHLLAYLGPVATLTALGTFALASQLGGVGAVAGSLLMLCGLVAASQFGIAVTHWAMSLLRRPKLLPRLDFERGIATESRTMVVVPTLLTRLDSVAGLMEALELRSLSNRDANLWFALVTDFCDADTEETESDAALLACAVAGIEALNRRYPAPTHGRFFLFHRPRLYNAQEGCWMGRERKRGKLEDFNALLCGEARSRFSEVVGDVSTLTSVRYVITLDTDTDLPWGAGWRLVGAAAHPLNRPVMHADGRRLARGYAILQPRVGISWRSAVQSRFSRMLAGEVGFDPYTRLVSDLYQDLFKESSFIGKGLYEVDTFRRLLDGRFPDNAVLSHDLLESCYARSGQCSDVELLEETPAGYLADVSRRHRWMRGDWQIAPWLGLRVGNGQGERIRPSISTLGWWKVFDNLRRAVLPPAYTALLILGWMFLPAALPWTLTVLGLLLLPELLPALVDLVRRPAHLPVGVHLMVTARALRQRLTRSGLWLTFLPFEGAVALDAAARSIWRMTFSRHRLLEWQTAAAVERGANTRLWPIVRRMWVGPTLALATGLVLWTLCVPEAALSALPILLLWCLAPVVAWWISQPLDGRPLDGRSQNGLAGSQGTADVDFLRHIARVTWRYFEVFVGPQENWLPPDNFQELPSHRVAHRTSPTNMGLALLANLSACDFGYLSVGQLIDRTGHTLDSMDLLDRHRGHFYNWYDTLSRRLLKPPYVSTVDSGNLVAHIRVLRSGLLERRGATLLPASLCAGLTDTWACLAALVPASAQTTAVVARLSACPTGLSAQAVWLAHLGADVDALIDDLSDATEQQPPGETLWWANALSRQVSAFCADLQALAPWLSLDADATDSPNQRLIAALDDGLSLEALALGARRAAGTLLARWGTTVPPAADARLMAAFESGAAAVQARLQRIDALARQCEGLATAEFPFLYDPQRKLLAIGYSVNERRLDVSMYDLLASEARLASYVAIAAGQLPPEHWFALGRRLTTAHRRPVLLSWSGSMFEYLMPDLVMPDFAGTLLQQTGVGVVARQIEYGNQRGVPWGISESAYGARDLEGTYQYRAFGVPGLGFQRGLADEVVVAPYASALALMVDPLAATQNLRRMARRGWLGAFGFYEAVDFAPSRTSGADTETVIRAWFAHHHGMSLLALARTLLGPLMQTRFMSNPEFQAAALLLHERVPRASVVMYPHVREALSAQRVAPNRPAPVVRALTHLNAHNPELQLLSNGRYHVMISAAGGGHSRWHDIALTRWREDVTAEANGLFCYVCDLSSGRGWSNTFQPTLRAGGGHTAIFSPGKAEFRRQDDQFETHTTIAVAGDDDVEVRRIRLTNRSESSRSMHLTSYAEAVLAPLLSDEAHRVFSNLFVETEILPELGAILVSRRPRSPEDHPIWMICMMPPNGEGPAACSFETDRARFIGRGRDLRHPIMVEGGGPLSGTAGAVLDPCMAIRRAVEIEADGTLQIDIILGAAPTRAAALALILRYQDHRMADRVFETAAMIHLNTLGRLGATQTEGREFTQVAAALIFADSACRAPASVLRRNRQGQAGLWRHGISGDLPIVLVRVSESDPLSRVEALIRAHAYWRVHGLATDLVIWNEDTSGYRRVLGERLLGVVAASTEARLLGIRSGVFLRHIDDFSEADRVLFQAVARVVIRVADGALDEQLERWQRTHRQLRAPMLAASRPRAPAAAPAASQAARRADLIFFNGTGGFTADGREYIIDLPPGHQTPAPWVNVIANARLGTVISERGSAYTWFGNAQQGRISPWSNDPVSDPSGELLFVRDEASGRFQSALPTAHSAETFTCRHGFGYSVFEHEEDDLRTEVRTFVEVTAPVKFVCLKITNRSTTPRRLGLFASVDLVLGDLRSRQAMHVVTELEPLTGALLARNPFGEAFGGAVVFFACSESNHTVSGDRVECLGRNGDPTAPAAMRLRALSGHVGPGLDPCAAILTGITLAPGAEREVMFILGAGGDSAEAAALVARFRGVKAGRLAEERVWRFWRETLGVVRVATPDPSLDVLINGWLPYQVLACRLWGRSGFYQSGGAFGFRDQLQDCLALLHPHPGLVREHILRSAARQFVEGDVQHWWHPPGGRGVRTGCSDDFLWLPYVVARYVVFTGDTGILDEQVGFLTGRTLGENEESHYDLPGVADQSGSVYEHCTRAIAHGRRLGAHGLPLMGSGDWNDGMNRVGLLGRGESVWLAFFLYDVLGAFAPLAEARADGALAADWRGAAAALAAQIESQAWDGDWYRRAWFDTGEPVGSAQSVACQIDLLPQSWATITGVGDPDRRRRALDAVWARLVRPEQQLVALLTPPFGADGPDPGYIRAYPPGVRENGGQYTHSAIWAAEAFALAGRADQALAIVDMINPIGHSTDAQSSARYKVEPYVLAADVYGAEPHIGRGGWTWYTGSAGWYYRLLVEVILGLHREGDTLRLSPHVPASWTDFTIQYQYMETPYRLICTQDPNAVGPARLTLDGVVLSDGVVPLRNDRQPHTVAVRFGPCADAQPGSAASTAP